MPYRVVESTLNASTIDILNVIRQNASLEYQNEVPVIEKASDIPRVGEHIIGHPALANQFINALVNRIAQVRIKSATFNNAYAELKKGYLEFGETVEEVFVSIAKAREFSVEKAEQREFQRTLPDVKTAFHTMNWRVQYPITIQEDDLQLAFLNINGVQDLIAKIVDSVYTAAEYDEYLLFKYLMIKAISKGEMFPVKINPADVKGCGVAFRGTSNKLTFMSTKYNATGVTTTSPKRDQYIFMDSDFNATYDVEVLAGAFNMDKAEFIGKLKLIDDWTSFDNDRFDVIRANSDMVEEVTAEELEIMKGVKAVLVDKEWFQIYDNKLKFTETHVSSGLYWNYFLNVWKTVSSSPFSNAVVFTENEILYSEIQNNSEYSHLLKLSHKDTTDDGQTVLVFTPIYKDQHTNKDIECPASDRFEFEATGKSIEKGVGVLPYGVFLIPAGVSKNDVEFKLHYIFNGEKKTMLYDAGVGKTEVFNLGTCMIDTVVGYYIMDMQFPTE